MINTGTTQLEDLLLNPKISTRLGLPTVIVPGFLMGADTYNNLAASLQEFNFPTAIVPLSRWDWLPTLGGGSMAPILNKLAKTVEETCQEYGVNQVNLVAHSAGGWISRIYLGNKNYVLSDSLKKQSLCWNGRSRVKTLVTLGTPHVSQCKWTRRNMDFVNQTYPDAYYSDIHYVCVAGKSVYGKADWQRWMAYNSYQMNCGQGNSWGDGITPVRVAQLKGARNIVLEGLHHFAQPQGLWYGSPEVISEWTQYLAR